MSDNYIFREAKIPLPIEKQKAGQSWVSWGENNDYPQFLIGLYYNSSIHGGIVNSKVKYIASSGLDAQTNDLPKWELIKKNGNAPFSLDEISLMVAKDFELLDSFAILFKKNPISKFWDAHHVSTELIRKGEDSSFFYYSENWKERNQTEEKTGFKKIKNIEDLSLEDKECLLYVSSRSKQHILDEKTGLLTKSVYPIPSYSGAIKSIMASIEMYYFYEPESIVTTNTSWLGENAESVLFYGALIEAYTYMKGDADLIALYTTRYNEVLARLKNLGEGLNKKDNFRIDAPRLQVT
jgi:hypothetical protein